MKSHFQEAVLLPSVTFIPSILHHLVTVVFFSACQTIPKLSVALHLQTDGAVVVVVIVVGDVVGLVEEENDGSVPFVDTSVVGNGLASDEEENGNVEPVVL